LKRVEFARILCDKLDQEDLPWSILHGAEGFPEKVGRDLDIILPKKYHNEAAKMVLEAAKDQGWNGLILPIAWAGCPVVMWGYSEGVFCCFEMHFIDKLIWAGLVLADGNNPEINNSNGLKHHVWGGFAKRVMIQILSGSWKRFEEKPEEFVIGEHEKNSVTSKLGELLGSKLANDLVAAIINKEVGEIAKKAKRYRIAPILRTCIKLKWSNGSFRWLADKFCMKFIRPRWELPIILLSSSDDRKSDAVELVNECNRISGFPSPLVLDLRSEGENINSKKLGRKIRDRRALFRSVTILCSENDQTIFEKIGEKELKKGYIRGRLDQSLVWDYERDSFHNDGIIEGGKTEMANVLCGVYYDICYQSSLQIEY